MYDRLRSKAFSSCVPLWVQTEEDPDITLQALGPAATGRVLCVASGGDTPLALLMAGAREVIAVDVNPAQVAVAEVKVRSVEILDIASLGALWLGHDPAARLSTYRSVEDKLTLTARQIVGQWLCQCDAKPLIEQGGMQGVGTELRANQPALAARLPGWFQTEDLPAQRQYHDEYLGGVAETVAALRQTRAEHWFGRGGESDAAVAAEMRSHFLRRFRHLTECIRVAGNPYAAHLLLGSYPPDSRPWYLTANGFADSRKTGQVRFIVDDIAEVVAAQHPGSLDGADLSNVTDLLSEAESARLFRHLARALRPGGRCVHRNLVWAEPYPVAEGFERNVAGSRELTDRDRSFVYSAITVDVCPQE